MSHIPYFWKEKSFKGWTSYVLQTIKASNKSWSADDLLLHYAPHSPEERDKMKNAVRCALSLLKNKGELDMTRKGHTGYYEKPQKLVDPIREQFNKSHDASISNVMKEFIATPIVLVPRKEYHRKRIDDIGNAVLHSIDQKVPIPMEWIEEYNDLIK